MTTHQRYRELGEFIRETREGLGLTMRKAAQSAEISRTTWAQIEAGEPGRGLSYAAIEATLSLPRGTCRSILDGKPAPEVGSPQMDRGEVEIRESGLPLDVQEELRRVHDRAYEDLRSMIALFKKTHPTRETGPNGRSESAAG